MPSIAPAGHLELRIEFPFNVFAAGRPEDGTSAVEVAVVEVVPEAAASAWDVGHILCRDVIVGVDASGSPGTICDRGRRSDDPSDEGNQGDRRGKHGCSKFSLTVNLSKICIVWSVDDCWQAMNDDAFLVLDVENLRSFIFAILSRTGFDSVFLPKSAFAAHPRCCHGSTPVDWVCS